MPKGITKLLSRTWKLRFAKFLHKCLPWLKVVFGGNTPYNLGNETCNMIRVKIRCVSTPVRTTKSEKKRDGGEVEYKE